MKDEQTRLTMKGILEQHPTLTPKARILGDYIVNHPRKAVFMTTKELALAHLWLRRERETHAPDEHGARGYHSDVHPRFQPPQEGMPNIV